MTETTETLVQARDALRDHQVIAYPTEGVFGLGCAPYDEVAVRKLLALKNRDISKGMILIAADYSQLLDYVDDKQIGQDVRFKVLSHWPGHTTLILPARYDVPRFLKGDHDTIAVRVTAFEPARRLCRALGTALVSTSANASGEPAMTSAEQVRQSFGDQLGWIMDEPVGQASGPSKIINPLTNEVVRT
ncbi:MAG: L-threonylcarbamoyladenylate synthase type 1 TsaC [Idiomarina sp.]|nr:L-threonylcarbamoyladenylate synthase type 1 TsaC [Idiomarina sp.]